MKYHFKNLVPFVLVFLTACGNNYKMEETTQKNEPVFPKGQKVTNSNFIGTVWLNYIVETDTIHNVNMGLVSFEPGARTNWHFHKGGQILLITDGIGLYQERGKSIETIEKGNIIKCPPNTEHWHGATPTQAMAHIAIGTNINLGGATWLEPVTDEDYLAK